MIHTDDALISQVQDYTFPLLSKKLRLAISHQLDKFLDIASNGLVGVLKCGMNNAWMHSCSLTSWTRLL